jgi:undecaprenyl-diphosphatase
MSLENLIAYDRQLCQRASIWMLRQNLLRVFRAVSFTADGWLYPLWPLLLLSRGLDAAGLFLFKGLLGFLMLIPSFKLIKHLVQRDRPCDTVSGLISAVVPSDAWSFPSGHTASAFLMATLISLELVALAPLFLGWAFLVGLGRVVLGVHYPTDVAAGAALGSGLALLASQIVL